MATITPIAYNNSGIPIPGTPSGNAVLIQSATTEFTIGLPVYVNLQIV